MSGGLLFSCAQPDAAAEATLSDLMRERTNQLQEVKKAVEAGLQPEGELFAYEAFTHGTPSRPALGEPGVQGQLMAFESFYARFALDPSLKNYNTVIQTCMSCHERLCPGPLRLIRSLSIEAVEAPAFELYSRD